MCSGRSRCLNSCWPTGSASWATITPRRWPPGTSWPARIKEVGDMPRAIPLYERVLADQQRVLGDGHPHTLTSRNSVAAYLRKLGETQAAREVDEDTLARRR